MIVVWVFTMADTCIMQWPGHFNLHITSFSFSWLEREERFEVKIEQIRRNFRFCFKVSKGANIRNRYNQVQHLNQDTNGKVTNSQVDTTNERGHLFPSR